MDPLKRQAEIVPDKLIETVFAGKNFGDRLDRNIVNSGVWKVSCGYCNGYTAENCLIKLGLATRRADLRMYLTAKGREYLRFCTMPIMASTPTTKPGASGEEGEE